jgi:predicted RNA-binding Zn-ribbon protein involved in translation (DUF1610 family)
MRGRMGGMHCTNCGKEIAPYDATVDVQQKAYRGVSHMGLPQKVTTIYLCPDCAASREAIRRTLWRAFGIILIALVVLAVVGGLFTLWR